MNRIDIAVRGPIMENLAEITISDDHARDVFTVDNADVEAARAEGQVAMLELMLENASQVGIDIVSSARVNGSPVYLEDADVDATTIQAAFEVRAGAVAP